MDLPVYGFLGLVRKREESIGLLSLIRDSQANRGPSMINSTFLQTAHSQYKVSMLINLRVQIQYYQQNVGIYTE